MYYWLFWKLDVDRSSIILSAHRFFPICQQNFYWQQNGIHVRSPATHRYCLVTTDLSLVPWLVDSTPAPGKLTPLTANSLPTLANSQPTATTLKPLRPYSAKANSQILYPKQIGTLTTYAITGWQNVTEPERLGHSNRCLQLIPMLVICWTLTVERRVEAQRLWVLLEQRSTLYSVTLDSLLMGWRDIYSISLILSLCLPYSERESRWVLMQYMRIIDYIVSYVNALMLVSLE